MPELSAETRDLLWKAWPDGLLPMRGVRTVGGWQCLGTMEEERQQWEISPLARGVPFWVAPDLTSVYGVDSNGNVLGYGTANPWNCSPFSMARSAGDLLPHVDPSDVATWTCLLADLALALGDPMTGVTGLAWQRRGGMVPVWPGWELRVGDHVSSHRFPFPDLDALDPADALVQARIRVREGRHVP